MTKASGVSESRESRSLGSLGVLGVSGVSGVSESQTVNCTIAQSHSLLQIRAQLPVSLNWSAGWTGTVPVWVLQVIRLTCLARATNLPSSAVLYEQIYSNAQLPDQPAL